MLATSANFVHARARLIATTHQLKHQLQTLVTAFAHAALQQLHARDQQRTGLDNSIRSG